VFEIWSDVAVLFLIYVVYASSLTLVIGYTGIPAVAPTAFGAIGGYMTGWFSLRAGWDSYVSLLIGILAVAVLGWILSDFVLQLPLVYVILLTVALGTIVIGIIPQISFLGGPYGLSDIPTSSFFGLHMVRPSDFIPAMAVLAALAYLLTRRVGDSTFGLVLRAIREDETALRACGFNPKPAKVATFVTSAGMAGGAGGALALYDHVVSPNSFGFTSAILIVAVAMIGGVGRPAGALLGAAFIQVLPRLLQQYLSMAPSRASLVQQLVFGAVLVAVMVVRPTGLIQEKPSKIVRRYIAARNSSGRAASDVELVDKVRSSDLQTGGVVTRPPSNTPILRAVGIRKSFGGLIAANGFDFELSDGQVIGLVGPNGAGKTTLFNLLTNALVKDGGTVELFGKDITASPMDQVVSSGMARSFQDIRLWTELTVIENVLIGSLKPTEGSLASIVSTKARAQRIELALGEAMEWLAKIGLAGKALVRTKDLSYGEQKLVGLARLMATDAALLLLDEPAAGVGSEIAQQILAHIQRLAEEGRSILLVEHNLDVVREVANWCYFMEQGSIRTQGTYEDLVGNEALAESYFGARRQPNGSPVAVEPVTRSAHE
jgi:branched-chain amino acid transport system permease protein